MPRRRLERADDDAGSLAVGAEHREGMRCPNQRGNAIEVSGFGRQLGILAVSGGQPMTSAAFYLYGSIVAVLM